MSQEFMDPELIVDFIAEAKEHLETIEPNLLELEKAPDNLALLNDIFRPMHSLKGASGFLALNRINMLAHRAENILDELRKGAMVVTSEIMDIILSATDALRQMIDNLERTGGEGDVAIEAIIAQIDAIMRGDVPAAPVSAASDEVLSPPDVEGSAQSEPDAEVGSGDVAEVAAAASQAAEPQKNSSASDTITAKEWIAALGKREGYVLTAFGEGHLKDFIDEAREITENLSTGLLEIERNPNGDTELVNDLFRYFHNLKGNSGIIGFHELNSLTHEAETLLNRVRHGEMPVTHELVDLLLLVVDVMDALTDQIDASAGNVRPFDISEVLSQLQQAVAGGPIELPAALVSDKEQDEVPAPEGSAEAESDASIPPIVIHPVGGDRDEDDIDVFQSTVQQQQEIIRVALAELDRDSSQKDYVDALFRSITAIQKASNFMGLKDLSVYAERTAALVNQGRTSGLDFSLMTDLLRQETAIINDMVEKELEKLAQQGGQAALPGTAPDAPAAASATTPAAAQVTTPAAAQATTPAAAQAATAKTEPAPAKPDAKATKAAPAAPKADAPSPAASAAKPDSKNKDASAAPAKPTSAPAVKAPLPAVGKTEPVASAAKPASTPAAPAAGASAGAAAAPAAGGTEHKTSSTIRVDHEKLDHLMNLIGELIINRNRYTMLARRLEGYDGDSEIADIAQNLSETTYAMARVSDDLQDTIMKVRMVPVSSVFSRFPRLVRDLSRKSGKEVDLILEGEETELDKSVVEVIGDPLVHLIRNSVDHGVEPEPERLARGKPVKGRVVLRAYHKGNSVAIEIEDDGQGLDPEKLREVAVRKGLMTMEEAKQLDDREAKELIFAPGFSSAEKITDISGRGVGMDVVRTNIKALKGSISIASEVGKGTKFTLSLPLTLAIIDSLMINVAGETFAIPLDAVSETTKIEARRLTDIKGRKAVTLRGEVLGIMELADLLNLERKPLPDVLSVVVIHDNDRRLGLVVDRLLERQEIVIKPLGSYLGDVRGISGATITGDGGVILILDPHEVYLMATSNKAINNQSVN